MSNMLNRNGRPMLSGRRNVNSTVENGHFDTLQLYVASSCYLKWASRERVAIRKQAIADFSTLGDIDLCMAATIFCILLLS